MDWTGFPSVPSVSAFGGIEGRKAEIKYQRHPTGRLTWRFEDSPADPHVIESDRIIGLLSVNQHIADDYSLLYVEILESPAEVHEAERTHFRHLMLQRPPPDLIKDFTPSGRSCWALRYDHDSAMRIRSQLEAGSSPLQIVISTKSGQGHADKIYDNLLKPYLIYSGCIAHDVHRTTSTESIAEICQQILLPASKVGISLMTVLLSGDGGVVDLVNGLIPAQSAEDNGEDVLKLESGLQPQSFNLIPTGTGNALAHSSGLTRDRTLGMSTLMRGSPEPLPLFSVRFSPPATVVVPTLGDSSPSPRADKPERVTQVHGAVVFSWALHAALVADSDTPAYRKLGRERFSIAAKENLFPSNGQSLHPYTGRVTFQRPKSQDWEEIPRSAHSYLLATLCSSLEEKFNISPSNKPLDGKLRLVHFGPENGNPVSMTGEKVVGLMQKAYDGGKHVLDPTVGYEDIDRLRLELNEGDDPQTDEAHGGPGRWRRICVDGKIFICEPGTVVDVTGPKHDAHGVLRMMCCRDQD